MQKQTLHVKTKQALRLSQGMMQSISVLQMDSIELEAFVAGSVESNPMLEYLPPPSSHIAELQREHRWMSAGSSGTYLEAVAAAAEDDSLEGFLRDQLARCGLDKPLAALCGYLAESLDENGYLSQEDLDGLLDKHIPAPLLEEAVSRLQALEPAGIAARDLSECLTLQLRRTGGSPLAQAIVRDYLEELGREQYGAIAKALSVPAAQVSRAAQEIRRLDPRPGASFGKTAAPAYIRPDVFAIVENGEVRMVLSETQTPHLTLNSYYTRLLQETDDPQTRTYLLERQEHAQQLIRSLMQRTSTLQKCAELIGRQQAAFFLREPHVLQPLTMQQAAQQLSLHISTVSRALRGKYLQCRFGVFPLSYFFPRSVSPAEHTVSSQQVKQMIAELVRNETTPLSDQRIADRLAEQGVHVVRRTVTKYREQLKIGSSSRRKKQPLNTAPAITRRRQTEQDGI